jgi:hypothetical protein
MGLLSWLLGTGASRHYVPEGDLPGPGTFSLPIVGESKYQTNLEWICGVRTENGEDRVVTATLILENSNPYDQNAVRVDIEGLTVGYLSRDLAKQYRARLQQAGHPTLRSTCSANIRGGWDRGRRDKGHYGVWLDLPVHD